MWESGRTFGNGWLCNIISQLLVVRVFKSPFFHSNCLSIVLANETVNSTPMRERQGVNVLYTSWQHYPRRKAVMKIPPDIESSSRLTFHDRSSIWQTFHDNRSSTWDIPWWQIFHLTHFPWQFFHLTDVSTTADFSNKRPRCWTSRAAEKVASTAQVNISGELLSIISLYGWLSSHPSVQLFFSLLARLLSDTQKFSLC